MDWCCPSVCVTIHLMSTFWLTVVLKFWNKLCNLGHTVFIGFLIKVSSKFHRTLDHLIVCLSMHWFIHNLIISTWIACLNLDTCMMYINWTWTVGLLLTLNWYYLPLALIDLLFIPLSCINFVAFRGICVSQIHLIFTKSSSDLQLG